MYVSADQASAGVDMTRKVRKKPAGCRARAAARVQKQSYKHAPYTDTATVQVRQSGLVTAAQHQQIHKWTQKTAKVRVACSRNDGGVIRYRFQCRRTRLTSGAALVYTRRPAAPSCSEPPTPLSILKLPMFHPHLPVAFATLAKIRDFLEALREACKKYKLGSTELDQIVCPDNMREPMYPEMGEMPELLGRTVEEVMRSYASGLAVVGTTRQRDGLKFPNYPDEKMKERLREEGQIPIIQQREVMPSRGFRVVQSRAVEPGAPRTVLQVMVRNTNLVMAARSLWWEARESTGRPSRQCP